MTNDNRVPSSAPKLPPFEANVVPTGQVRTGHLRELLSRYAQGSTEPLILGENGAPQAAIIPFSEFIRLMRHDQATHLAAEANFQEEVRTRLNTDPTPPEQLIGSDEEFTAWADTFAPRSGGERHE